MQRLLRCELLEILDETCYRARKQKAKNWPALGQRRPGLLDGPVLGVPALQRGRVGVVLAERLRLSVQPAHEQRRHAEEEQAIEQVVARGGVEVGPELVPGLAHDEATYYQVKRRHEGSQREAQQTMRQRAL